MSEPTPIEMRAAIVDAALAWERARQRMFEPGMNEKNPELHDRASAHTQREKELRALLRQALKQEWTT